MDPNHPSALDGIWVASPDNKAQDCFDMVSVLGAGFNMEPSKRAPPFSLGVPPNSPQPSVLFVWDTSLPNSWLVCLGPKPKRASLQKKWGIHPCHWVAFCHVVLEVLG